jgi:hypothetical protein
MAKPLKQWMKRINDGIARQMAYPQEEAKWNVFAPIPAHGISSDKWWNFGDTYYTRWLELSPTARFVVAGSAVAGTVGLLSLATSSKQ